MPIGWSVPPLGAESIDGAAVKQICCEARVYGKDTQGRFIVRVIDRGPVCSLLSTRGWMAMPVRGLLYWRSMLARSAAPSQGVPSWNEMLGRTVMVHLVKSLFAVSDSAR